MEGDTNAYLDKKEGIDNWTEDLLREGDFDGVPLQYVYSFIQD